MSVKPKLIETLLASDDVDARTDAAEQLARMGQEARTAAVALVRAAGDSAASVRDWAAAALEELGPPQASDIEALAALAGNPQADIAYWAVTLLGRAGDEAADVADAVAEALSAHPTIEVRQRAAWALGKFGARSTGVLAALRVAAASDEPRLARLAKQALAQLGE
jgi:HEAT repeat protein